jgi:hypothetical protein
MLGVEHLHPVAHYHLRILFPGPCCPLGLHVHAVSHHLFPGPCCSPPLLPPPPGMTQVTVPTFRRTSATCPTSCSGPSPWTGASPHHGPLPARSFPLTARWHGASSTTSHRGCTCAPTVATAPRPTCATVPPATSALIAGMDTAGAEVGICTEGSGLLAEGKDSTAISFAPCVIRQLLCHLALVAGRPYAIKGGTSR